MRNYSIVSKEILTADVEGTNKSDHLSICKQGRIIKASRFFLAVMVMLFIYPDIVKSQPRGTSEACGAHTSFLLAGDSLMIAYQLLTGATNYSLKVRKSAGGTWLEPVGDVASGCSRMGYFVLYLRDQPNQCQKIVLQPGSYLFEITAYDDLIQESCVMSGDFYLTSEEVWKTTYSTWDVFNPRNVSIIKK